MIFMVALEGPTDCGADDVEPENPSPTQSSEALPLALTHTLVFSLIPQRSERWHIAKIVIIGAGLAGLATALFLGGDGHDVLLLESDVEPPSIEDADAAFDQWRRQGAGQARQSHMFLGLSSAEMMRGAPEVLQLLLEAGALHFHSPELTDKDGTPAPVIGARRFAYELALRRAISLCRRIKIRPSTTVAGLLSVASETPYVTGVRLADGNELPADLIVDCAGRRSMAHKWLVDAGSRPVPQQRQACGFTYLTRWYRLREGYDFPAFVPPASARLPYMAVLACPADRGSFSITLTLGERDSCRKMLRSGEKFDRVARAVPVAAAFLERGEATTEPIPFGNIANQRRSLLDANGPIVRGYVLIGDSSMHTNPTMGRGTSLAFAQARHLRSSLQEIQAMSSELVSIEEEWASDNLKIWFDSQIAADAALADRFDRLAAGEPLPDTDVGSRTRGALFAAVRDDPGVAREFRRTANLLITPPEFMASSLVKNAMDERLTSEKVWPEYVDMLPRRDFEQILS